MRHRSIFIIILFERDTNYLNGMNHPVFRSSMGMIEKAIPFSSPYFFATRKFSTCMSATFILTRSPFKTIKKIVKIFLFVSYFLSDKEDSPISLPHSPHFSPSSFFSLLLFSPIQNTVVNAFYIFFIIIMNGWKVDNFSLHINLLLFLILERIFFIIPIFFFFCSYIFFYEVQGNKWCHSLFFSLITLN